MHSAAFCFMAQNGAAHAPAASYSEAQLPVHVVGPLFTAAQSVGFLQISGTAA
jgi:hypothetical protein